MMETMEWAKQSEDMLKTWTESQKKLWDEWTKAMPSFGKSPSTEVWEKTVEAWRQTVQRLLDAQIEAMHQWAEHFTTGKGTPQETAEWAKQGQEMLTRLAETQKQLWESWFDVVKKFDASNMMNWPRDGQKFIQTWQETIQKAFDAQADWVRTTAQTRKKS
jgi:hypothetical protein